jgi:hypothetical protein
MHQLQLVHILMIIEDVIGEASTGALDERLEISRLNHPK